MQVLLYARAKQTFCFGGNTRYLFCLMVIQCTWLCRAHFVGILSGDWYPSLSPTQYFLNLRHSILVKQYYR